ncbi:MAG: hypothetical protein GX871_09175, partial [Microbacteriaceae bacterium]|nr:hypothetical protein [Microbacteriaceae bacterium]
MTRPSWRPTNTPPCATFVISRSISAPVFTPEASHTRGYGSCVRLCLASTSPARLALLRSAGIEPLTASPGVDEAAAAAEAGPLSPHDTVLLLARLKAEDVAARIHVEHPRFHGLIVGGDS